MNPLTVEYINLARERIAAHVHKTPLLTSSSIDSGLDGEVFFKCENFQKVGAFKARGACNALLSRQIEEIARGVVTHSSGNAAQGLAYAAQVCGVPAYIVMPKTTTAVKVEATKGYGASVTFCEPTLASREEVSRQLQLETGAVFVHPYNDYDVMAGQGTVALEILEQVDGLDAVLCPIGGGGLISGISTVIKSLSPNTEVIGVEPEGAAEALLSLQRGEITAVEGPKSIAEGLLSTVGTRCFPVIQQNVDRIVTVSDGEIRGAMRTLFERMKLVVEASGAATFAALEAQKVSLKGKRVAVVLSGGNTNFLGGE
ncbi:MAG: threonine/serine dehydratase [Bdellovibrionales bacterium]|nr:threonine/serine dehydratase [Bdellovibrionales bacterium]